MMLTDFFELLRKHRPEAKTFVYEIPAKGARSLVVVCGNEEYILTDSDRVSDAIAKRILEGKA